MSSCCRQGSLLGPLLFLLASSDVLDVLALSTAYADDTTSAAEDEVVAQSEICALESVSASVGLTLNGAKTQMLVIGSKNSDLSLVVDGDIVRPGNTLEILGFCLDYKLGTGVYLDKLHADLRKSLGILRMLRYRVSKEEMRDFAYGILMGRLTTYVSNCIVVRTTPEEPVNGRAAALQVILNDLARLRTGKHRSDHIKLEDLLHDARVPSVNQLVARGALSLMWTAMVGGNGPLVPVLSALLPASNTRAANSGKLNTPAGSNAIVISGCKLWNEHHVKLRSIKTRKSLKTFITKEVWKTLPI